MGQRLSYLKRKLNSFMLDIFGTGPAVVKLFLLTIAFFLLIVFWFYPCAFLRGGLYSTHDYERPNANPRRKHHSRRAGSNWAWRAWARPRVTLGSRELGGSRGNPWPSYVWLRMEAIQIWIRNLFRYAMKWRASRLDPSRWDWVSIPITKSPHKNPARVMTRERAFLF